MLTDQRFLRLLNVLMYWTSGLPFRRKKLIKIAWCNHETARNIYISNGLVVFITGYHKSFWKIGFRLIVRYPAPKMGELLMRYLIYVPVFVRFLNHCMQYPLNRVFFFGERDKVWSPDRFGDQLKR